MQKTTIEHVSEGWDCILPLRLVRWGLGYGVRIPREVILAYELKDGDKLKVAFGKLGDETAAEQRVRELRRELIKIARQKIGVKK